MLLVSAAAAELVPLAETFALMAFSEWRFSLLFDSTCDVFSDPATAVAVITAVPAIPIAGCPIFDSATVLFCDCCILVTGLLGAVLEFELELLVVLELGLVVTVELESLEKIGSNGVAGTFLVDTA